MSGTTPPHGPEGAAAPDPAPRARKRSAARGSKSAPPREVAAPAGRIAPGLAPAHLAAGLLEGTEDAIVAYDLETRITAWSAGAERLYGYPAHEMIGRPVTLLVPSDRSGELIALVATLRAGEGIDAYETERLARDGRRVHVLLTAVPLRGEDGGVVGACVVARDIGRRKRLESRLRLMSRMSDRLTPILDARPLLLELARLCVPDLADYCITYLLEPGDRVARVGVAHADPAREPLVHDLLDEAPPALADPHGAGAVIRTGEPLLAAEIDPEMIERAASGSYLALVRQLEPGSSMVLPLKARGRTVGALALTWSRSSGRRYGLEDLAFTTELADRAALALDNARLYEAARHEVGRRQRAEEALRKRYSQLRAVYRMAEAVARAARLEDVYEVALEGLGSAVGADRSAILLFDDAGVMRFRAARGLSAEYRRAVEGHSPWAPDAIEPEPIVIPEVATAAGLSAELRATLIAEGIGAVAFVPLVFAGRLLGKVMLYFDRPRGLVVEEITLAQTVAGTIAFAITRVTDEQRVLASKEAAERASRAKSQFLGVMSHELRTPLNSVVGYSDLLLLGARGPLTDDQRGYIARIQASARHQLGLIEELLTYTRLEAGREDLRLIETDVRRVVSDVAELIRPEVEHKQLELRVEVAGEPLVTLTDPARLRQIVLNLAANAVKFTATGSVVLRAAPDADGIVLEVEDTGRGINPDDLASIWEPFVRGHQEPSVGGTGLGLAIVRRLTALLGGAIDLDTAPGRGSRFTVRLPLRRGSA